MSSVSDIKLIRTDTILDLSQKAEKRLQWFHCYLQLLLHKKSKDSPLSFPDKINKYLQTM